jgi:hypothetical protein
MCVTIHIPVLIAIYMRVEYVAKMSTGMLKPYNVTAVISGTIQSVQTYHHIFTKHFNLLDISIRSSVSKNVVEKFGRPH